MKRNLFKDRYRLTVEISNQYIKTQIIYNDRTIASASSMKMNRNVNIETAIIVGNLIADKALENKIEKIVFDRCGKRYHGRVKALADAVRAKGIVF